VPNRKRFKPEVIQPEPCLFQLPSILPVEHQRLVKYPLLLEQLLKQCDRESDMDEYNTVKRCVDRTREILESIDRQVPISFISLFFVAKPSRRSSEPDRGGFLFLCQEQSTDKISLHALVALAPHLDKCNLRQDVI
jgi:hypothetical protein